METPILEPPSDPARIVVLPWHQGMRLDQLLAVAGGLSRRQARRSISDGVVSRNGQRSAVQSRIVETGDVVELTSWPSGASRPAWQPPCRLTILAEDSALVAVDKPAGMLSQPAARRAPGELACDELLLLQTAERQGRRPYLRLVHRLDRLTSGTLLFARRAEVMAKLSDSWRRGLVRREYLAVVGGRLADHRRIIDAPIARDRTASWRFWVADGGAPSSTEIEVLLHGDTWTLVRCLLRTGRTHQVRVHLAYCGHPVLGDRLYGGGDQLPRPLLHAAALDLPHPSDGGRFSVRAPHPPDLVRFLGPVGATVLPGLESQRRMPALESGAATVGSRNHRGDEAR